MQVRPASPDELRDVLRLSCSATHRRPAEVAAMVENFTAYAKALSLDLSRQWVVADGPRRLAGCTCIDAAGRLTLLLAPAELPQAIGATAAAELVQTVAGAEARRGAIIMQALFEPGERAACDAWLPGVGFAHLARLCYLERRASARRSAADATAAADLIWTAYQDSLEADFAAAVSATYADSLDCPALTRLRSAADALASHRAAGIFRPQRWFLMKSRGRTAGCLLLSEAPLRTTLEIVYMGVAPHARGRGLGRALLEKAVAVAGYDGFDGVSLAVDAANAPALRLYRRFGFQTMAERDVWIRALHAATEG